jgi:hypothetical protein
MWSTANTTTFYLSIESISSFPPHRETIALNDSSSIHALHYKLFLISLFTAKLQQYDVVDCQLIFDLCQTMKTIKKD